MLIRYDTYDIYKKAKRLNDTPCIIYDKINRSRFNNTNLANWHEDLEIQVFTAGEGYLLISSEKYAVKEDSIAIINSNSIHYNGTDSNITYYPIIIDYEFCKKAGIDCPLLTFETLIDHEKSIEYAKEIIRIYFANETHYKKAKLQAAVLNLLIDLCENHIVSQNSTLNIDRSFVRVKAAVRFIRENYSEKLTLDIIAKNSLTDKYSLSKNFKKLTGQTVVEYITNFRCERIKDLMYQGVPSGTAAIQCGFNNISFFTKTFKKYTGMLPSQYKKLIKIQNDINSIK